MKNRKLNQLLVAGMISAAMMTSGISVQAADFSDDTSAQEQILDILMIAKYYERIGDHATNIAEWAEYAITGVHRNSELEEHL